MEELELKPISSMFEEQEETTEEFDTPLFGEDIEVKEEVEDTTETKVEEDLDDDEGEEEVDLTSVKTLYNHWKEYLPFDEVEEPTVEFLREQQDKMPEKLFLSYVETRPDFIQDLLAYQSKLSNPTIEEVKGFFDKYIDNSTQEVDVSTSEGARQFLKKQSDFIKIYKTEEKIDKALDMLEDDGELIDKAKELVEENNLSKVEAKKLALQKAEEDKQARLTREKEFASQVNKTIEELSWKPERKMKVVGEITPKNIGEKWNKISTNPKALVQFADFLTYFDGDSFDAFYKLIEGKEHSKETVKTKGNLEKDSLGKLLGKQTTQNKNVRSLMEDFG